MYFIIDRRRNLTLRAEIDRKIASLRQAQSGLMLLGQFSASPAQDRLMEEIDLELIHASECEQRLTSIEVQQ